ncbi:hypothetical protein DAEQUDRAFT_134256 [Daedalea quercina L-15889]|uniref:Fungal-type protein kinase domain-containing protein n=1 Tax=Daedalea quercina L-15889 TaxID=1314783 RepID=A0A165KPI1_9APHY|nr:hypothetical protein DAEQUDRAFT_134256 [Daedalea quercina L-15889]
MHSEEEPGIPSSKVACPHVSAACKGDKEMYCNTWNSLKSSKETLFRDVKYTVTKTTEEMGLPHTMDIFPGGPRDSQANRNLILKSYRRLEDIGSAGHFHAAFVDAVCTHHCMYEASKTLHGDIGVNNIMWDEGRDGQPVGVLCDWDLAENDIDGDVKAAQFEHCGNAGDQPSTSKSAKRSMGSRTDQSTDRPASQATGRATAQASNPIDVASPDEKQETSMSKPRYRTGTGPFMALDLLRDGPPPLHKYRHDLESFFYIYITFAAVYDPPKRYLGKIMQWQQESLSAIGDEKHKFLMKMQTVDQILNPKLVHDEFKPFLDQRSFLMVLHAAFAKIESLNDRIIYSEYTRLVNIRMGLPTDELDSKIMKTEEKRDSYMTYSKFMEILNQPEDI